MAHGLLVAFWVALGMAVGSFLNVVADRLPQGASTLFPPSHCESCNRRLRPAELVPVLSYLIGRGQCQSCGASIGRRVLAVELGTGLLFFLTVLRFPATDFDGWKTLLLTSVYLAVLLVVTITDLEHGFILNHVILPAIGLGIAGALLAGWPDLLSFLVGGLVGAGVIWTIIILVPGGMGWGDVRLAGFIGLVSGLQGIQFALFLAFVSGGLLAGTLLASGRYQRGDTIPLGPFLAFGGAAVLLYGQEMLRVFHNLAALF